MFFICSKRVLMRTITHFLKALVFSRSRDGILILLYRLAGPFFFIQFYYQGPCLWVQLSPLTDFWLQDKDSQILGQQPMACCSWSYPSSSMRLSMVGFPAHSASPGFYQTQEVPLQAGSRGVSGAVPHWTRAALWTTRDKG